ncbi:hypothetical protein GTW43_10230 [Streptomyces sp. SID5785]|uniref:hypothetical protein n=1 Tax=Streptomyces sp. SID5785 TaxID=2690309 RepID=UPI0013615556|nr:hypothetical protein [Streptomyces sp. SID5785]
MTSEQNPAPETPAPAEPRPGRLTAAAALAGVEGAALLVGGAYLLVGGLTGDPDNPEQAMTGGITLIVLALLPLLAARGLLALKSWSRGPAIITQIMALPVAYTLGQSGGATLPVGIVLAVVAVSALVLLVNPATTVALGIRMPGSAKDPE